MYHDPPRTSSAINKTSQRQTFDIEHVIVIAVERLKEHSHSFEIRIESTDHCLSSCQNHEIRQIDQRYFPCMNGQSCFIALKRVLIIEIRRFDVMQFPAAVAWLMLACAEFRIRYAVDFQRVFLEQVVCANHIRREIDVLHLVDFADVADSFQVSLNWQIRHVLALFELRFVAFADVNGNVVAIKWQRDFRIVVVNKMNSAIVELEEVLQNLKVCVELMKRGEFGMQLA